MMVTDMLAQWRAMRAELTCAVTARERERLHKRYLQPIIDGLQADDVDPQYVLEAIKDIIADSSIYTGRRLLADLVNAYDYAGVLGQVKHNPAARLAKFLPSHQRQHRAFVAAREFGAMLRKVDAECRSKNTAYNAFYALVFTALRRQEVVLAQWGEIHWADRIWVIPPERMKMKQEHIIPISSPLLQILARQKGKDDVWVFPSPHQSKNGAINRTAVNQIIWGRGYGRRQTIHGVRHVFSTRANDSGIFDAKVIERQLDHRPRGVAGVYDKSTLLTQRRHLMDWWADQVQQWRGLV